MSGWIKLHRKSKDHWLYNEPRPATRREAWEDMLLLCNHSDQPVLVQGELIESKRGQSVRSLSTWAKEFRWSIKQVRTFLKLLESDHMIVCEGLRKTTRITICNYEIYQGEGHTEGTQRAHKGHTKGTQRATNNNDKNDKNEKNEEEIVVPQASPAPIPEGESVIMQQVEMIVNHLNTVTGKNFSTKNKDTVKKIRARLAEGHPVDAFFRVIDIKTAEWMGTRFEQYLKPGTLFRETKFEGYVNQRQAAQPGKEASYESRVAASIAFAQKMLQGGSDETRRAQ